MGAREKKKKKKCCTEYKNDRKLNDRTGHRPADGEGELSSSS